MWLAQQEQVILDSCNKLHKEVQGTLERLERICIWLQTQQERGQKKPCMRCAMKQKWTSKRCQPHWLNQGPWQILQRDHPDKLSETKEGYQYLFLWISNQD